MGKKYEFTGETKVVFGITLRQVRALVDFRFAAKGEIGGWIEDEKSLSQDDNAWVSGDAQVYGKARVSGNARVSDNAQVSGYAQVSGKAQVSGNARVSGDADFMLVGPLGFRRSFLTVHADAHVGVRFSTGCFSGSESEFSKAVEETHGESEWGRQYMMVIELSKLIVKAKEPGKTEAE